LRLFPEPRDRAAFILAITLQDEGERVRCPTDSSFLRLQRALGRYYSQEIVRAGGTPALALLEQEYQEVMALYWHYREEKG